MTTASFDEFSISLLTLTPDVFYPKDELDDSFFDQYNGSKIPASYFHSSSAFYSSSFASMPHSRRKSLPASHHSSLEMLTDHAISYPPTFVPPLLSKVDLDMTRISDRIVTISQCWKHRTEKLSCRNNVNEMFAFLNSRYRSYYMIWNLSPHGVDELQTVFGSKLMNLPGNLSLSSLLPFSLLTILSLIQSMVGWLKLDPRHVVVLHCSNGRQRSGK